MWSSLRKQLDHAWQLVRLWESYLHRIHRVALPKILLWAMVNESLRWGCVVLRAWFWLSTRASVAERSWPPNGVNSFCPVIFFARALMSTGGLDHRHVMSKTQGSFAKPQHSKSDHWAAYALWQRPCWTRSALASVRRPFSCLLCIEGPRRPVSGRFGSHSRLGPQRCGHGHV